MNVAINNQVVNFCLESKQPVFSKLFDFINKKIYVHV